MAAIIWDLQRRKGNASATVLLCFHFDLLESSHFISLLPRPDKLGIDVPSWDFRLDTAVSLQSSFSLKIPVTDSLLKYPLFKMFNVSVFLMAPSTGNIARKPLKMRLWDCFRYKLDLELIAKLFFSRQWDGDIGTVCYNRVNQSSVSVRDWSHGTMYTKIRGYSIPLCKMT